MAKISFLKKSIFIAIIIFVFAKVSYSQDSEADKLKTANELNKYAESVYGVDDRLINGEFYQNLKIVVKGHPNFLTNNWSDGPLFVKGVTYKDVRIKYNLELDKVILLAQFSSGNVMQLALNNNSVDSLFVNNHFFINSALIPFDLKGFYEPIYKGNIKAYIKHKKDFLQKTSTGTAGKILNTGSYRKPTSTLYIHINNDFIKVSNKKALISLFEENKKELSKFIQKNKINLRNANNSQLINLLKYCDEISSKPNNEK